MAVVVAPSLKCAKSGKEVMGLIPAPGDRSELVGSLSVLCDRLRQTSWSPHPVSVWLHVKLSDVVLRFRPRDRLLADEDIKNVNKQATPMFELVSLAIACVLKIELGNYIFLTKCAISLCNQWEKSVIFCKTCDAPSRLLYSMRYILVTNGSLRKN